MPNEHNNPCDPRIDPGSFELGRVLARLEHKLEKLSTRVEQIARSLAIGPEAAALTASLGESRHPLEAAIVAAQSTTSPTPQKYP